MPLIIEGKKSSLQVPGNHIRVNSSFNGRIVSHKKHSDIYGGKAVQAELLLTCLERTVKRSMGGPGQRETIDIDPIWQDRQFCDVTMGDERSNQVSFEFIIPDFVHPSDPAQEHGILWQLEVKWKGRGTRFKGKFELLVEAGDGSAPVELPIMSRNRLIEGCKEQKMKFLASGSMIFPRVRNLVRGFFPMAIGGGIMAIGLAAKSFGQSDSFNIGWIFTILFGLVGLIFVASGLYMLTQRQEFTTGNGKFILNTSSIYGRKKRSWGFDKIKKIFVRKSSCINNILYYKMVLEDLEENTVTIGEGIKGYSFAHSLAQYFNLQIHPR